MGGVVVVARVGDVGLVEGLGVADFADASVAVRCVAERAVDRDEAAAQLAPDRLGLADCNRRQLEVLHPDLH